MLGARVASHPESACRWGRQTLPTPRRRATESAAGRAKKAEGSALSAALQGRSVKKLRLVKVAPSASPAGRAQASGRDRGLREKKGGNHEIHEKKKKTKQERKNRYQRLLSLLFLSFFVYFVCFVVSLLTKIDAELGEIAVDHLEGDGVAPRGEVHES
jgi:hypothetical protein